MQIDFSSIKNIRRHSKGLIATLAMVFVWSQLTKVDANYTQVQVAVNDLIMVFAFAPIAAFLLGVTDVTVP